VQLGGNHTVTVVIGANASLVFAAPSDTSLNKSLRRN
jgi:hypothetical protein